MKSLFSGLLLALLAGHATAAADGPILIKFSHVVADDTPKGQGALLFKKLVEERLGEQVRVEVYPNSSLYGDGDELQALLNNEVQLLAPSLSKFSQYTPKLQVFDLPFLFDDLDAVNRFQKRAKGRQLLSSMEKSDITGLAYWHNGMKQLSATQPLQKPSAAAGLAFRIQSSPVLESQFQNLGAKAVKLPFADTLQALRSGTVQGTENSWSNLYSQQYAPVQPYMVESNHGVLDYMLVTNSTFWYSLSHSVRIELDAIIDEVTYTVNRAAEAQNREARERLAASGQVTLVSLSAQEREAWRQAMQPVWQQFEGEIGSDIIHAAKQVNRRSN
ncbi:TRAP transporter substrate-binding protein [Aquipseudomonas alcaligenes]|uniref:TRAP transporter substrate-binding protein n=1 Tax=Aquipseudomonas alcaligenes TaxID=43263 RepID=UPI00374A6C34